MADEPENLTLRLLREIREENTKRFDKIDERLDRLEANGKTQAELLGKVMDATLKIAETQQVHGHRLNIVDARLATIERELGLVKA